MPNSPEPRKRLTQDSRKQLPENPSEENLRKQAKHLAKEESLQLAAAQRQLAIEYGYQNWAELMKAVTVGRAVPFVPLRELIAFPHETYPIYVGRPMSIKAIEAAANAKTSILMVAQRDAQVASPSAADMYEVGTLGTVSQWLKQADGTIKAVILGKQRARVSRYVFDQEFFKAECAQIQESEERSAELAALMQAVVSAFDPYWEHEGKIPMETSKEFESAFAAITDPAVLSDTMVRHLRMPIAEKQALLETIDPTQRLERILAHLNVSR
jgi:ATP-dependent Lon protease